MNSRNQCLLCLILISALLFTGCDKKVDPNTACDLTFPFNDVKWMATNIQPSECKWMLFKHEYQGSYYYSVGNHCVDMAPFMAACDGVNICNTSTTAMLCGRILEKGTALGIVAVEDN